MGGRSSLTDSYIHDLASFEGAHNDAVEVNGAGAVRIEGNTILNSNSQTSVIMISAGGSANAGVLIRDNLLGGGGYTVYGDDAARGITVTGNAFSTRYFAKGGYWGPVAYWSGVGNVWSGNYWLDGAAKGQAVGEGRLSRPKEPRSAADVAGSAPDRVDPDNLGRWPCPSPVSVSGKPGPLSARVRRRPWPPPSTSWRPCGRCSSAITSMTSTPSRTTSPPSYATRPMSSDHTSCTWPGPAPSSRPWPGSRTGRCRSRWATERSTGSA